MDKNTKLDRLAFYMPELDDIMNTVEAYPISMNDARKLVRIAAIIDTERSPGYTEKFLIQHYKEYHGWTGEH